MTAEPEARRITGPHLLGDRTGAALDVFLAVDQDERAATWEAEARRLLDAVGWSAETTVVRPFPGGAHLFVSAPLDGLYPATDLAELAWSAATSGGPTAAGAIDRLRERIERDRNPALLALEAEAARRDLTFLHDDDGASVGSGRGVRLWPNDEIPDPSTIDWSGIHDVPIGLVTGSNGKTSTVRFAAAMAREAGHTPGYTSTDGVSVGRELIVPTDFAGPMGARVVLRDPRVTIAILETARGGILRRGLAVRRADAALVTNIAADHLGDFGVGSVEQLLAAKLVVTRVVPREGAIIFNADDALLRGEGERRAGVTWFSRGGPIRGAARQVCLEGDSVVLHAGGRRVLAAIDDLRHATGATAPYEIENVLAASALALALGVPESAIAPALRRFEPAVDNPGRGTVLDVGGAHVLVDYGHNPHGIHALRGFLDTIPARRRLILLGQAGDRDDAAIAELAAAALELSPDRILLKELPTLRRGRGPGEVRAVLRKALLASGFAEDALEDVETEVEAAERALAWAEPGDLLVLLVHEERGRVLELLRAAEAER
ncbi:MAG TPA: Mur ligase family protein [Gemmatimonadales bacterium]